MVKCAVATFFGTIYEGRLAPTAYSSCLLAVLGSQSIVVKCAVAIIFGTIN